MEEEGGAVRMDLLPCPTDSPGPPVDIRGEHDLARLLDLVHLRQGCMPEGWQHGLGVLSVLTVAKHGGPGLRFDRFASKASVEPLPSARLDTGASRAGL